jgi:colanic acid biosynthesis glycosyl transferase WcaI
MQFVLLTQYYPPEIGGAQVLLSTLACELRRYGHEVRVVTALPNYPTGRIFEGYRGRLIVYEEQDGVAVLRTWVYPAQSAKFGPRLANYLSFCATSFLTLPWIGKPDIIFVDSPPLLLPVTARWIAKLSGAQWIMNISDLWPDSAVEMGMIREGRLLRVAQHLEQRLYRRADFVSAVTDGIRSTLTNSKGVPEHKLLFLPIGVDTEIFKPRDPDIVLEKRYGLTGKRIFLFAGTLGHAQALPSVIEAADMLRDRPDIALVFVGDGPVKNELRASSQRRCLMNVHFVEPVPLGDMTNWWSIARAALVTLQDRPIFNGARPSKSLPALASGVPVIFAGRGEMAEILKKADAGLVEPPEHPGALADAIRRLADDEMLARKLGQNGRRLCETEFCWHTIVGRWLEDLKYKTLSPQVS